MPHGGKRAGAGRPKGKNIFGEKTMPLRIPESQINNVLQFVKNKGGELPLYSSKISAGTPAAGDDHIEKLINLYDHLIKNPTATFLVRAFGESMIGAGIHENDLLIVDRCLPATDGKVVVAVVNGEMTVKRICCQNQQLFLMPENERFKPIEITDAHDISIWGVVTSVIHAV